MTKRTVARETEPGTVEVRYRPLYARALGLRHLHPGGMLCFVYLEGTIALSLLLALAELVSWWVVLILPVSVALMVKVNDLVAGAVARSVARTPERERELLRREVSAFMPVVGRATVVTREQHEEMAGPQALTANPVESVTRSTSEIGGPRTRESTASATGDAAGPRTASSAGEAAGPRTSEAVGPRSRESATLGTGEAAGPRTASSASEAAGPRTGEAAGPHIGEGAASSVGEGVTPDTSADDQRSEAAAAGRDTTGRYAAAGEYLDAAWRQHAYAMAHQADHAGQPSQRERQSASRRYE